MPVDQVQKLINAIDNNKTEFTYAPIVSKKLRELVKIPEPEKFEQQIRKDELKQQIEDLKDLLNNFIKNSGVNNGN